MEKKNKPVNDLRKYTYYSGLAIQMAVIIAGGTYGGVKLDQYLHLSPLFTLIGSLGSIALALYLVIKDFIIKKTKK